MTFEWKIALRFLKEGRGQSVFILLGISIGVAVMIFLNTLITGLQKDLINQTVGSSAHIWISGKSLFDIQSETSEGMNTLAGNTDLRPVQLSDWENISDILEKNKALTAVSPVVEGNAFYTKGNEAVPVIIKGFQPEKANSIYPLSEKIVLGSDLFEGTSILVGIDFLEENDLSIGDTIRILLPSGGSRAFVVNGAFDLGSGQRNASWIVMDFANAQRLLGYGNNITRLEIQVADVFQADTLAKSIGHLFREVTVGHWIEENSSLLSALNSQSASSYLIQAFVLLAITLGISSVLFVSVQQKSKQLGILKAMGTTDRQASHIFLLQGGLLGLSGALAGAGIGIGLVLMFLWGTSLSSGVPLFPLSIDPGSIVVIIMIAVVASTAAAFVPAKRSSRLNPVEVIRNG